MATGLRERRKQQTRQAISDIATVMFVERGYDVVTIADVAQAAGVAKMTVTNYFPRKEDLVFDRADEVIRHLAKVAAARPEGESLLGAFRRDYAELVAADDPTLGLSGPAFAAMVAGSPALRGRGLEMAYLREQALADRLIAEAAGDGRAAEVREAAGETECRLVAALLAAVYRVCGAEAARRSLAGEPREQIRAVIGELASGSFDLLEPALARSRWAAAPPPR